MRFHKTTTLAMIIAAWPAVASADLIHDYNLVVTGNLSSTSEVEGRTIVGGNLSGSSNYAIKLAATTADTLDVGGNITGNVNMQAGTLRYAGSIAGATINLNGGSTKVFDSSIAGIGATDAAALAAYSSGYSGLAANGSVTTSGNNLTFDATGITGVAVFKVDGSIFNVQNELINLSVPSTVTSVVVDVSGTSVTLGSGTQFGNSFQNTFGESNVLFNFAQATSVTLQNTFFGALLAPNATLTNNTAINGGVFVKNFNQQGEVHLPNYAGFVAVPEPCSVALLGLGLPGIVLAVRRSRARAA